MPADLVRFTPQGVPARTEGAKKRRLTFWKIAGWSLLAAAIILLVSSLLHVLADSSATGPLYLALINLNLLVAAGFSIFAGRRFFGLMMERRRMMIGARMHVRLMGIFGLIAILPAVAVTIFSVVLLKQGFETWFSSRVANALDGSIKVAQAYLEEHGNRLLAEAEAISRNPAIRDQTFLIDPETLRNVLEVERVDRQLAENSVYDQNGNLIAHVGEMKATPLEPELVGLFNVSESLSNLLIRHEEGRIVAAAPINRDMWVVLTRWVHPTVLAHRNRTHEAYREYYELKSESDALRATFTTFLIALTSIALAGAVWSGWNLAGRIVRPVAALVHATNKVRGGDYGVRVEPMDDDEIGILTQTFNRMAEQLKENRDLLETKNRELDERRRTIEAVLTGVSAGVISVDREGTIRQVNRVARETLGLKPGERLPNVYPQIGEMLDEFLMRRSELLQHQLRLEISGQARVLLVRMVPQERVVAGGKPQAVVVTFDDVTELIAVQRVAAWADVARRMAHEIKNPLTPIKLSAERLKRKYGKDIKTEPELFSQLTDTIVRQVEDLRMLVNEFSDFARMPSARFAPEDLREMIEDILLLQKTAYPHVQFEAELPPGDVIMSCDKSQIRRVLTNLVQNAVNAIEEDDRPERAEKGLVKVVVKMSQADTISLIVEDNGRGLPAETEPERLFDPYMTTRRKGTGLGLAIVRRVMDEHNGQVRLNRRPEGGTAAELVFPARPAEAKTEEPEEPTQAEATS